MLNEYQERAVEIHRLYLEEYVREDGCSCGLKVFCVNDEQPDWDIQEQWV